MRQQFVANLLEEMHKNENIYVLLGDLGFNLFDEMRNLYPSRCINIGASEQLMIGMAAGLAMENKIPVCYTITPFLIYRPFEFIRNFMQDEKIPIKLVGSGRGKDYIDSGFTHFSEEVGPILGELNNISTYFPESESELLEIIPDFLSSSSPAFLSLRKYI